MNRIYLVRHGENYANITKEFSYKLVDYDLTEKGFLQARQTAEYFADKKIDAIYSSPLKRAIQTANCISQTVNQSIEIVENFRELNVGDLEKSKPNKHNWDIYFQVTNDWYEGRNACFPNGEDYNMLLDRFYKGLDYVTQGKDNKDIIVVGHGGIFTVGVIALCSIMDKKGFISLPNHNCSISEINLDKNGADLNATIIRWADNSHLYAEAANFMNALPENK